MFSENCYLRLQLIVKCDALYQHFNPLSLKIKMFDLNLLLPNGYNRLQILFAEDAFTNISLIRIYNLRRGGHRGGGGGGILPLKSKVQLLYILLVLPSSASTQLNSTSTQAKAEVSLISSWSSHPPTYPGQLFFRLILGYFKTTSRPL